MNPRFSDPFLFILVIIIIVMFCYGMPEMAANVSFDDKERFVRDYLRQVKTVNIMTYHLSAVMRRLKCLVFNQCKTGPCGTRRLSLGRQVHSR